MGGGKIAGASVPPNSKPFPSFGPQQSLFGGPVLPQPSPHAKLPIALQGPNLPSPIVQAPKALEPIAQGQRTMPGGPLMPTNPFPELGRKLVRWNGF
jgi:hypothetical protein